MGSTTKPPPMSHVESHHDRRQLPRLSQQHYQLSPTATLVFPPLAHINPNSRPSPPTQRTDPNRNQSSISSGESGSTVASDYKPYLPKQSYQYASQAERGLVEETRQPYLGSQSDPRIPISNHGQSEMIEDQSAVYRYIQQQQAVEEQEENADDHALWILLWMSFLDPMYCLFNVIFTIFALFVLIITSPIRLCQKDSSSSTTLIRMVAPVFRNHLKMIYAKSLDSAHTFEFSPVCLVLVQVASPILSIGNAIAAWVVAVFWIFAIIMGNPDGTENRDDGRATVLMLRDWWEKCLLYAIRK